MKGFTTVDDFFNHHKEWNGELKILRKILLKLPFEETIKWGAPTYTVDGKNVVGIGAFKSYVGLWFFNGSFLRDNHNKLFNAQEGKTRGMRQWRFGSVNEMDEVLITEYLKELIENQKAGKTIKIQRDKSLIIPNELFEAFEKNNTLKFEFDNFSKSKQREFAEYISEAKRERTKVMKLEKIIPMILNGMGLYTKYKNR